MTMYKMVNGEQVAMTADEEAAFLALQQPGPVVPQSVSMRQARLAIFNAGLLSQVEAAINAMAEPDQTKTRISWDHASIVVRTDDLVTSLGASLGLTAAQIDSLFIQAAGL